MSDAVPGQGNLAFIDGQNLYMGTMSSAGGGWRVDLKRFRAYLRDKYVVEKAFYFFGYVDNRNQEL